MHRLLLVAALVPLTACTSLTQVDDIVVLKDSAFVKPKVIAEPAPEVGAAQMRAPADGAPAKGG